MFVNKSITGVSAIFVAVLSIINPASAVCPDGQMAVGTEDLVFYGQGSSGSYYSGFLMANDCGLISQNGITQAANQMCHGDYSGGASVHCDNGWDASSAVDTEGNYWTCYSTSDSSCNKEGGSTGFRVSACCYRD